MCCFQIAVTLYKKAEIEAQVEQLNKDWRKKYPQVYFGSLDVEKHKNPNKAYPPSEVAQFPAVLVHHGSTKLQLCQTPEALEEFLKRHLAESGTATPTGTGTPIVPIASTPVSYTLPKNIYDAREVNEIQINPSKEDYTFAVHVIGSPARGLFWVASITNSVLANNPEYILTQPNPSWVYFPPAGVIIRAQDDQSDGIDGNFYFIFDFRHNPAAAAVAIAAESKSNAGTEAAKEMKIVLKYGRQFWRPAEAPLMTQHITVKVVQATRPVY